MGVVYKARQLALDLTVALKVITSELADDPTFRKRFQDEARLAASIEHPNVLPVRDAGEEQGLLYLTMRYVEGTDLRSMLERAGHMKPLDAASITAQVAAALDAAHAHGLVHRDVKPGNVLIEERPDGDHAYLGDFGLTKDTASKSALTETGMMVGTLDYVAPEQVRGDPVDARADVYALGCMLYELLSGHVPFERESDLAKLWAHVNEPPPALDPALELDHRYDQIIQRAMAKDPDGRYPSAGDLARAVQAVASGGVVTVPERSVAQGRAANPQLAVTQTRRRPARLRAIVVLIAVLLSAIVAAAVAIGRSGSSGSSSQRAQVMAAIAQLNAIPRAAALSASLNATATQMAGVLEGHGSAPPIMAPVTEEVSTARQLLTSNAPPTTGSTASARSLRAALQDLNQAALTLQGILAMIEKVCGPTSCRTPATAGLILQARAELNAIRAHITSFEGDQNAALSSLRTTIDELDQELAAEHVLDQPERQQLATAGNRLTEQQSAVAAATAALDTGVDTRMQVLAAALASQPAQAAPPQASSTEPTTTPPAASTTSTQASPPPPQPAPQPQPTTPQSTTPSSSPPGCHLSPTQHECQY